MNDDYKTNFIHLKSSISRDEADKSFDHQAQEQSKSEISHWSNFYIRFAVSLLRILFWYVIYLDENLPSNIEVSLCSEQSHVHLHLSIQVTHANSFSILFLTWIFLHLSDGIKEE